MRRLVTIFVILLILALAWSGGWLWLAAWAERNVAAVLARIEERGLDIECGDRDVVGFPFALKVACGETAVAERHSGARAQLAGLTGGASVFAPRTARIALASPVLLQSPLLTGPAEFRWDSAGIDVGMGMSGPQSVAFEASGISGALPLIGLPETTASASDASAALAPSEDGGTNAAFSFDELALLVEGDAYPPFNGSGTAILSVPPRALLAGRAALQAPLAARDISVTLTTGEARIHAAGDISVDAEGIVDGTVTLRIAGSEALPPFLAALPPERQKIGNAIVGGMMAFGSPAELDGEEASELTIEIVRGRAKVGPVEVRVPRLPI